MSEVIHYRGAMQGDQWQTSSPAGQPAKNVVCCCLQLFREPPHAVRVLCIGKWRLQQGKPAADMSSISRGPWTTARGHVGVRLASDSVPTSPQVAPERNRGSHASFRAIGADAPDRRRAAAATRLRLQSPPTDDEPTKDRSCSPRSRARSVARARAPKIHQNGRGAYVRMEVGKRPRIDESAACNHLHTIHDAAIAL